MPGILEKFVFELETFLYSIRMSLSLAKQLMSPHKLFLSSAKLTILISWSPVCTPLIPCVYFWNACWPWFSCNNIQKHGDRAVLKNYLHHGVKRSERRPFIFIFRLSIALHDSYKADETVMEIKEWKQKVPHDYVKNVSRVLLSVLETSIISYRSCIIWIFLVLLQFDYSYYWI